MHAERLVGPLVVVDGDEAIEPALLLPEVGRGRFGRFLLQGEVHALVSAILLRAAWLDALDLDAEAEPPDGQTAEAEQGIGAGEGAAVVGPD